MSQRRMGSKFGIKNSSRSSSSRSSSASLTRNSYRESTPFSTTTTTTAESSDDDNGIVRDFIPTMPTTPISPTPTPMHIALKQKKQITPVYSHHFTPPLVVITQQTPQTPQPQPSPPPPPPPPEISELPELPEHQEYPEYPENPENQKYPEHTERPVSDNSADEFNHFRRMKKRIFWSPLELEALESGMNEFGTQWARILRLYGGDHGPLRNRNAVQLKDKARNEKLRRIKNNLDLGIFCMATGGDDILEDDLADDS